MSVRKITALCAVFCGLALGGCATRSNSTLVPAPGVILAPVTPTKALPMLRTEGTRWLRSDGSAIALKGTNLGNWLMPEFWMMGYPDNSPVNDQCTLEAVFDQRFGYAERERLFKLHRDNWITARDWDIMPRFGLNVVRLPFIWSVVEDEKNPRHLRADAWHYLDDAINQAEARGMYVILDLHGAVGAQGDEHHSGCANQNQYFKNPEFQARTEWLWRQVATRYKDRSAVAGYSVLNEPWGTDPAHLVTVVRKLYSVIRAADPNHVIILPGHSAGIDAYGKPADHGMTNVAFEMHFYPGHFGWGKPGLEVHKNWLHCLPLKANGAHGGGTCEWRDRLNALNTAFFVGEFQPWADMSGDLAGQVARASFDRYAELGWASSVWSYKMVTDTGGLVLKNWGLVTNAAGATLPLLDFRTAPLAEIEARFRRYGDVPYDLNAPVLQWMNSATPPPLFAK